MNLKATPPTTSEGVERYLGGFVEGVGPVFAKKLVEPIGADVLGVISDNPTDLESLDGIGLKRRERIATAWREGMQIRGIILFLYSHGVSTGRAVRIFKIHGNLEIQTVHGVPLHAGKGDTWHRVCHGGQDRAKRGGYSIFLVPLAERIGDFALVDDSNRLED